MTRLPLAKARMVAEGLLEALSPSCERIEIAGSIRRGLTTIKDVELVAIPQIITRETGQAQLFGGPADTVTINRLHERITEISAGLTRIQPIKPGTPEPPSGGLWEPDDRWDEKRAGDSRYWRLWIPRHEDRVDLFLATQERWGCTFTIRTGSADFSAALVRHWTEISGGGHFHEGRIHPPTSHNKAVAWKNGFPLGPPLNTPEEADVFSALGLQVTPPEERHGPWSLRKA